MPKKRAKVEPPSAPEEIPLGFMSPESSAIVGASYDADNEVLTVTLRDGERHPIYHYDKFPMVMWREFLDAPSKGKYFQSRIRPIFSATKTS